MSLFSLDAYAAESSPFNINSVRGVFVRRSKVEEALEE